MVSSVHVPSGAAVPCVCLWPQEPLGIPEPRAQGGRMQADSSGGGDCGTLHGRPAGLANSVVVLPFNSAFASVVFG